MNNKIIEYIENDDLESLKRNLLSLTRTDRSRLVNSIYTNNTNLNCGSNHLLMAALRNNFKIAKFLINECDANLEMNISLKNSEFWDNFTFFSYETNYGYKALFNFTAPILWHLCRINSMKNIDMVKFFVSMGANANSNAESYFGSTPLMAACLANNLTLVRYLIEEVKVDVNILDSKGENCLFYAVRNIEDNLEMIKYLISHGADVQHKNTLGRDVFIYSIDLKKNEKFNYLISQNPGVSKNLTFESPLVLAALNGDCEKFDILIRKFRFDSEVKIFALEIIGSKMCEKSTQKALDYWEMSLIEGKKSRISKDPIYIHNFLPEFNSVADLSKICQCSIEMIMQNLLIRERVLIKSNRLNNFAKLDLYNMLFFQLKKFNQENFFAKNCDRIQYLWTVTLGLQIKYLRPLDDSIMLNLLNLAALLNYLHTNRRLAKYNMVLFDEFLVKTLKICLHEMNRVHQTGPKSLFRTNFCLAEYNSDEIFEFNDESLVKQMVKVDCCASKDHFYIVHNLETLKKISVSLIRLLIDKSGQFSDDLVKLARNLVVFDRNFIGEMSILAMSLKSNLLKDYEYQNQFKLYDPVSVRCIELFLRCGADPDSKQHWSRSSKNNCVNACIMTKELYRNKALVDSTIDLFLKHGAHLDYRNDHFKTFIQKYEEKYLVVFKDKFNYLSLKCLCAVVLKRNGLSYKKDLPKVLVDFVDMH